MKKLLLLFFTATTISVNAQLVTLFAGSPYEGDGAYSGATGSINKFTDSFSYPWAIAPDTSGRFWVTDQHNLTLLWGNNSIVKGGATANPNASGSADYQDKTGTNSRFANPAGCAVNPKNNRVYICDADNSLIRYANSSVVNSNDLVIWSTLAGVQDFLGGGYVDGNVSVAEFSSPQDIAISSTGVIYICDRDNHCIRKISGSTVSTIAGLGQTLGDVDGTGSAARFYAPTGIFLVDDNTLLVADRNNGKIKQIDLTNNKVTTVVATGLSMPTDIVSVNGIIYIADAFAIRTWNGTALGVYAGKVNVAGYVNASDVSARFSSLMHISYDNKTKSIYITDMGNNVFRKLTVIQPPVANFTGTRTNTTVNEVVTLKSTSTNSTGFTWVINPTSYVLQNGSKLTDSIVYVTFSNVGSYNVELTASNATGSNKMAKSNYINVSLVGANKPGPDFYADKTFTAIGETVSFIDQTTDNPTSWTWAFTPNTVTYQASTTSTSRFPKVSFNANGKYTVQLTSSNTNGSNSKTKTDYIEIGIVSVKNHAVAELVVYPNPATDNLFVGYGFNKITLTSIGGQQNQVLVENGIISLDGLSAGVYVVQGIGADGTKFAGRFVKLSN